MPRKEHQLPLGACALISVFALSGPVAAENPLQAERLNPIECLLAVHDLHPVYRSNLGMKCLTIAVDLCFRRESGPRCISDTQGYLEDFYQNARPMLPAQIDDIGIKNQSYQRSLVQIDRTFESPNHCPNGTDMQRAHCEYTQKAQATINLMLRLRQANIPPQDIQER